MSDPSLRDLSTSERDRTTLAKPHPGSSGGVSAVTPYPLVGHDVWLECPLCPWRSSVMVVGGAPNAAWYCYTTLRTDYRRHVTDKHRGPSPLKRHRAPDDARGES